MSLRLQLWSVSSPSTGLKNVRQSIYPYHCTISPNRYWAYTFPFKCVFKIVALQRHATTPCFTLGLSLITDTKLTALGGADLVMGFFLVTLPTQIFKLLIYFCMVYLHGKKLTTSLDAYRRHFFLPMMDIIRIYDTSISLLYFC